ncbi:hypothetical protein CDAR_166971 [Caerostris darwini]|uniref:Uncharacterized protein n=1 Tax=Caerostris darwini TaxID=1538125 RepID=A0AAV4VX46_9ARAC|nr:hypothetical protein CDAR_166971 [Caerostris darwini]
MDPGLYSGESMARPANRSILELTFLEGEFCPVVEAKSEARTIPGRKVPFCSVCICMIRTRQKFRRVVETHSGCTYYSRKKSSFCSVCICMIRTRFVFVCGYESPEKF